MTRHAVRARRRNAFERLRRLVRYRLVIPVFRSPHSPEYTARGVANGVLWGLTPFIGFQTIAILTTWVVARRLLGKDSSVVQALIWSWVNNPVTMVPMYYLFYLTGLWLTGMPGSLGGYAQFTALWDASASMTYFDRFATLARAIGVPTALGCVPYSLVSSWLAYRWALGALRHRRSRLRRFAP